MEKLRELVLWRPERITLRSALVVSSIYQLAFGAIVWGLLWLQHGQLRGSLVSILEGWDAHHYLFIARQGYSVVGEDRFFIVFLPLYPLCIRALSYVVESPYLASLIVSNVCSIAGHALFISMLSRLGVSAERCLRSAILLFVCPTAIYFFVIYTEGLYLALLGAFFWFLYGRRFPLAALAGFLASLTKVFGVYLAVAYYLYLLERPGRRLTAANILAGLAIPFGFLVYLYINYAMFGDPLQFLEYQRVNWNEELKNPISRYIETFSYVSKGKPSDYYGIALGEIATLSALPLMVIYAAVGKLRLPLHLWGWTLVNWILICSQSFWLSNIRYLGVILPFYLMLEDLSSRVRFGYRMLVALSAVLCSIMLYLFLRGHWAA